MPSDRRRSVGAAGERLASDHLVRAGYRIVERNFRTRYGELDLVAVDRRQIVFCEVKTRVAGTRAGPAGPLDAIGHRKRRQVRLMASEWLSKRAPGTERPARAELRFDAVGVVLDRSGRLLSLEHVEGAF